MSKLTNDDYKKLYCYWAEQHYNLEGVSEVSFDIGRDGPYSTETPDVYVFVEVVVRYNGILRTFEESNVFDLINSINNFITENLAVGIRRSFILTGEARTRKPHPIRRRRYQGE
jgi:hypothetical protein